MSYHAAGGSEGPYLVVIAFWQETADTDRVTEAVRSEEFPPPHGYPKGAAVTFRREVALEAGFRRSLGRFDLSDLYGGIERS